MASLHSVPKWMPSSSPTQSTNPLLSHPRFQHESEDHISLDEITPKPLQINPSLKISDIDENASGTSKRFFHLHAPALQPGNIRSEPTFGRSVEMGRTQHKSVQVDMDPLGSAGSGVSLTWINLCVMADGKEGVSTILRGLNGCAQPGEFLAIMGPSGCGKSTLLDALCNINGRKQALAYGTSAYATQDDTLMSTLTVWEAVYYSAQLRLPSSMSSSQKIEGAEITIQEMGLQDAIHTRIGAWGVKGLSGGQKRRVSICIEILTRPSLLFLDEPTSGLDSAASYHVMTRIARLALHDDRTVVASIHKPSAEVFGLFNTLCLLSGGKTLHFGRASEANDVFTLNGFPCPSLRNPSDHFLHTINTDFDKDIEQGSDAEATEAAKAIDILVNSYNSTIANQVFAHVADISKREGEALTKKGSQASFFTQASALTRRSFVNMYRDFGYYWLRLAIYIALCLCIGTIFFDIGHSFGSIQARGSMLMFVAAFLTFMAIGGFPSFVEDMKIFGRERLNGHYGVGTYIIGNTLSSIPYLLLTSLIPGAIAYYLAHLRDGAEHFLYFALVLFVCMMLVESLMMVVASLVPNFLMGIITGAGVQAIMILNGGFFRVPNDLPKLVWKYPMFYISFHKYANQGLYKNEFEGLAFPNGLVGGPATITGESILRETWQMEMGYSKWVDLGILMGMVVFYRLMFLGILKLSEKERPVVRGFLVWHRKQATKVLDPMP
ncbi:hypothetical protein AMTRI_Chr04g182540 [Amborella trichopoda]